MILSSHFFGLPIDWPIFLYLRGTKNGSSVINLTKKWITSSSLTEPPVGLLCKLSINCPSASELCKTNKLSWQSPFNSIQNRVNWIQTEYIDSSISLINSLCWFNNSPSSHDVPVVWPVELNKSGLQNKEITVNIK